MTRFLLVNANSSAGQGPALGGVVGQRAWSTPFGYSQALRGAAFAWSDTTLDRYLTDPQFLVRGTCMAGRVASEADRRDLIAYPHFEAGGFSRGGERCADNPSRQG